MRTQNGVNKILFSSDGREGLTCQKGQPAARGKSHGASDLKCAAWGKPYHQSPETAQTELTYAFWEPFGHQSPEQLKISLQRPSESHVATRAQNGTAGPGLGGPDRGCQVDLRRPILVF